MASSTKATLGWLVFTVLVSLCLGLVLVTLMGDSLGFVGFWDMVLLIPSAFTVLLVLGVAHEGGHLLMGRLLGFRPLLLLNAAYITSDEADLRLGLNSILHPHGTLLTCVPADTRDIRRRMQLMLRGGQLMNILVAVLAATLFATYWLTSDRTGSHSRFWILYLSGMLLGLSVWMTLYHVWPGQRYSTDAKNLAPLRGDAAQAERWACLFSLAAEILNGLQPQDWNTLLLLHALQLDDDTANAVTARGLAYYWALSNEDSAGAATFLEQALAKRAAAPLAVQFRLLLEAAYLAARYQHDATAARAWLAQVYGTQREPAVYLRAEAAVLLAEGKRAEAALCASQALAALGRWPKPGLEQIETLWAAQLLEQAGS